MASGGTTATFESALEAHGGVATRTTAADFDEALAKLLDQPAVGVPIPIAGVSLDSVPVDSSLTPAALEAARTGVTPATFGVAALGTVHVSSRPTGDEPVSLFPDRHVAVLAESDLVPDLEAGFERLQATVAAGSDSGVLATGPSTTADMGAPVRGVHGPSDVHVLVVTDR